MLKAFLFTLALADFGAGAIVHPLHAAVLMAMNRQVDS